MTLPGKHAYMPAGLFFFFLRQSKKGVGTAELNFNIVYMQEFI